jgi:hypothetical protein
MMLFQVQILLVISRLLASFIFSEESNQRGGGNGEARYERPQLWKVTIDASIALMEGAGHTNIPWAGQSLKRASIHTS